MNGPGDTPTPVDLRADDPASQRPLLGLLLAHQRRSWRQGRRASVEDYLAERPELRDDAETVLDLIYNEIVLREEAGETLGPEEYQRRFPHLAHQIGLQFEVEGALGLGDSSGGLTIRSPLSGRSLPPGPAAPPEVAGYEILGELGRGGMGVVYKARQVRLNRLVALKMIRGAYAGSAQRQRFQAEAGLDVVAGFA